MWWIHLIFKNVRAVRALEGPKEVRCERCGGDYGYVIIRRVVVNNLYITFSSRQKAYAVAYERAGEKARQQVFTDHDPVACPGCGWIQTEMVNRWRKRFLRWIVPTAWALSGLALIATAIAYYFVTDDFRRPLDAQTRQRLVDGVLLALGTCACLMALRYMLSLLINPNRNYREGRPPIPGTPKPYPLNQRPGAPVHRPQFVPLPSLAPPKRMTVQLGKVRFPPYCCRCLIPTQNVYKMPCGNTHVPMPTCPSCATWAKTAKFVPLVISLLLAGLVGAIAVTTVGMESPFSMPIALGSALLTFFLLMAPMYQLGRPAKLSRFSSDRNVVRIRFKNRAYARVLLEQGRII